MTSYTLYIPIYIRICRYMPVPFCICPYMRWQCFRPVCGPWCMSLYIRLSVYMLVYSCICPSHFVYAHICGGIFFALYVGHGAWVCICASVYICLCNPVYARAILYMLTYACICEIYKKKEHVDHRTWTYDQKMYFRMVEQHRKKYRVIRAIQKNLFLSTWHILGT